MSKFYAVHAGRKTGVFDTWAECRAQVHGHPNAAFKSFEVREAAEAFVRDGPPPRRPADRASRAPREKRAKIEDWVSQPAGLYVDSPGGRYVCYTDGSAELNESAGIGVVFGPSLEISRRLMLPPELLTNQVAELEAIACAMTTAIERGMPALTIRTDSMYAVNGVTTWIHGWIAREWKTASGKPVKNREQWERIAALTQQIDVRFEHVPGHRGVVGNERADVLASRGRTQPQ